MKAKAILPQDKTAGSKHVGVFSNKDCMYFGALVGEYYFCI
jgi:hypothetical protein